MEMNYIEMKDEVRKFISNSQGTGHLSIDRPEDRINLVLTALHAVTIETVGFYGSVGYQLCRMYVDPRN